MSYKSLQHFIRVLEENNELIRIKEFVDPVLEVAEITDRVCKQDGGGKAILFENTGTGFPVLTNMFGSTKRASLALNVLNPEQLANEIEDIFISLTAPKHNLYDKIRAIPKLAQVARWLPRTISGKGACQEIVHPEPDLNKLPVLKCWPFDGGRFVTLPMVITKDPNTGVRNVGMYRMQIFGSKLTGMHWHRHKTGASHFREYKERGELMPVAVALGGDPAYTYSATAPLPENIDEFLFAGFLRKKKVKLVKCLTVELEVPYDADIIIEGYVDPAEEPIWEGPFGDHTGFYSLADWYPKFHVTCITHKRDAIYPATIVGIPPMEDAYMAKLTERIFLSPIKLSMIPELIDLSLPLEGVAHNIAVVKISKTYPGQAHKVAHALWGAGQMMFNKFLLVVDGDIDIHNPLALAKHIFKNFNPKQDILFSKGPLDVLDHSSQMPSIGGKMMVDATTKFQEEIFSHASDELVDPTQLSESLGIGIKGVCDYSTGLISQGISLLIVSVDKGVGITVKNILNQMASAIESTLPKAILIIDSGIKLNCLDLVCWFAAGNMDPQRDCYLLEKSGKHLPCLVLDGTSKNFKLDNFARDWPNVVVSDSKTIIAVDKKWIAFGIGEFVKSPSIRFEKINHSDGAIAKSL